MDKVGLALVGATGIVGQEILSLLSEEAFEGGNLQLSASDDSIGEMYDFRGKEHEVLSPEKLVLDRSTLTVLCTPRDVSQNLLSTVRSKSLAVLDCSGIDRDSNQLQLMPDAIKANSKVNAYSVKSPSGFVLSSFLEALELSGKLTSLVATTIEPVSGAGRAGLDELWNQTRAIFSQTPTDPEFFPEQIAFNIMSQVDVMREDGVSAYEERVVQEALGNSDVKFPVSVTSLRAPIMYGSGVSLFFETSEAISSEKICKIIASSPRFVLDQTAELPPSTLAVIGDDRIHLGRLRVKAGTKPGSTLVSCWLVADNIRACIARPVVDLYRSLMPVV